MSNVIVLSGSHVLSAANPMEAVASVTTRISIFIRALLERLQHRHAMKRFERFSNHGLQDVGFERDWDGSIHSLNR